MSDRQRLLWLSAGILLGGMGVFLAIGSTRQAVAATHDRYEDYIMCTGPVSIFPTIGTSPASGFMDGVWLLDYKAGKLLATAIDRMAGKIVSWAEVDLVAEFNIQPKQNVHFMMVTGSISQGQAALYVAETSTGKFGVYTLGPRPDGMAGMAIRRHDMVLFRQAK